VSVNRKNKAIVSAKLPVRIHGSANELPRLTDHSGALVSRMLILRTSKVFRGTPDDDPGLNKRILNNELGIVLRWAVEGLALLNAADGRFTLSKDADKLAEEMADESSNVRQFVHQCCTIGTEDDYVDLADLFHVFGAWAGMVKSGERMSQTAFAKALNTMHEGPIKTGQKRRPGGECGKWLVVYGITRAETKVRQRDARIGSEITETVSTDDEGGGAIDGNYPPVPRVRRVV
jgi:putative DNA primase/helicase